MPPLNLVYGNHRSTRGIEEILFALYRCLAADFAFSISRGFTKSAINVIIDEFADPRVGRAIRATKKQFPDTKFVVVATEFITPLLLLGRQVGIAFNFFGSGRDWLDVLRNLGRIRPTYMAQRYRGFVDVLDAIDLMIAVHPKIADGFQYLRNDAARSDVASPILYPTIDLSLNGGVSRLTKATFGFALTGTVTRFRAAMARELIEAFRKARLHQASVWRTRFEESSPIVDEASLLSIYKNADADAPLFNFNPPQSDRWPYSSPMRIFRAAMCHQIPIVTRKFGDHQLEDIAILWDGRVETASELCRLAFSAREELVTKFAAAVAGYNLVAGKENELVIESIKKLTR